MSIRLIKKDEVFSASYTSNGAKVLGRYGVRQNDNAGDRYEISTVFDFTNVTNEELRELAAKSLVGDCGRRWRVLAASNAREATTTKDFDLLNVREHLDAPRTRNSAPVMVKARRLIPEMTADNKAELLAILLAEKAAADAAALAATLAAEEQAAADEETKKNLEKKSA